LLRGSAGGNLTSGSRRESACCAARCAIARRYADIASAILADQGGIDQCSESRKQLVRRFAAAAVLAENLEAKLANGEPIDIAEHALLCSTLTRLAQRIGTGRTPREVETLDHYLASLPGEGAHLAEERTSERIDAEAGTALASADTLPGELPRAEREPSS
jgi:hypothetical protein